ncbi:unnamed protein product [Cuscuta epithymum]|uniref:Uncharacterized protein n=1 Tax=Cuscuta epithymum TaxID=186058 RepID=A0AAV0FSE2_9ASTE|nr:unnamed protein product [Cuscuta epithymum]
MAPLNVPFAIMLIQQTTVINIVNHYSESLNSILNHWFTAKDDFENLNSQVAIYICWIVWKRRNMYIYDDIDILISEAIDIINKEIQDVSWAKPFVTKATDPPILDIHIIKLKLKVKKHTNRVLSWARPTVNFIKINIAIRITRDENIISGIIIRDSQGHMIHYQFNTQHSTLIMTTLPYFVILLSARKICFMLTGTLTSSSRVTDYRYSRLFKELKAQGGQQ